MWVCDRQAKTCDIRYLWLYKVTKNEWIIIQNALLFDCLSHLHCMYILWIWMMVLMTASHSDINTRGILYNISDLSWQEERFLCNHCDWLQATYETFNFITLYARIYKLISKDEFDKNQSRLLHTNVWIFRHRHLHDKLEIMDDVLIFLQLHVVAFNYDSTMHTVFSI